MHSSPDRGRAAATFALIAFAALAALALAPRTAHADDAVAQLRYLSTVIRDRLPTVGEARAFAEAKDKPAALDALVTTWLGSSAHRTRVARHFNDMFGVQPWVFLADESLDLIQHDPAAPDAAPADLATAGVWHLPSDVKASCGTPVTADAWWSDTPISICPSAVSAALVFAGGTVRCSDPFSANGIRNAQCGCGPQQILCYPRHLKRNALRAVAREFADRAVHAYQADSDWLTLLGGNTFIGDRWLYHHYLWQERVVVKGEGPTTAELAFLRSLPLTGRVAAPFPASGGPERSGLVTSPAFLRRFNNFRSRVRALTEQLLCQDVDGSLNTDGIDHFVNPWLLANPFERDHGTKEGCSSCHFALDNFGSALLGWTADGFYEAWAPPSQLGHAFGETGTGPRFLMRGYVERADGFAACMAKRAWEGFSGGAWSDLAATDQDAFVTAAAAGPRATIRAVLTSDALLQRRARKEETHTRTETVTYTFADVAPVLEAGCAGSACHSEGNPRGAASAYVGNEAAFKTAQASRISSGSMPPPDSGRVLTAAERDMLLLFLAQ